MTRLIEVGGVDIEAIRDQFPLRDFIDAEVKLDRQGKGLCPFHAEKSPSFKVYEKDQRYHCFGCGAHGDLFDYAEQIHGWDIRQTAEQLGGGAVPTYTVDRIAEIRAKRLALEEADKRERQAVIAWSRKVWDEAFPSVPKDHPYIASKGITAYGARLGDGDAIITPLMGPDGLVQCVQAIHPDGRKEFPYRGTVTGGFMVIGGKIKTATDPVLLCEGYATGCSLHEATGRVVVVSYNGGNMVEVARLMAGWFPDATFAVAGDDDHGNKDNAGIKAAVAASEALGCGYILPLRKEGSTATDFNDMAAEYGLPVVTDLILHGVVPQDAEEPTPAPAPDIFQTLSLDDLDNLPAPTYLIDGLLPEHGLSVIYGEPGSYKSFIAIDMALRIAFGMDWHGSQAKQVGVLYIAGEGRYGIGKRVKGWRKEHGMEGVDAPFKLLPVAVHMLDKTSVEKLNRTIAYEQTRLGFDICLTVIDTVSRAMPGQEENKQEIMSMFVEGCAQVQNFTSGAVLGVHHSGKDKERGMRGSNVLHGACDATLQVSKDDDIATINVEKQKDDEQPPLIHMSMKKVEWPDVGLISKPVSTLIPFRSDRPVADQRTLSKRQADEIINMIDEAWLAENPWSAFPQAKRRGRYLVDYISDAFEVTKRVAEDHVTSWQTHGYVKSEAGGSNKAAGLRVIKRLEQ